MSMKRYGVMSAAVGGILLYAPTAFALAYAGNGVAYAGSNAGYSNYYQPVAMPYQGYGYQPSYQYPSYPVGSGYYAHPLDHNLHNPNTFTPTPSQFWVPAAVGQPTQYGFNGYYDDPYYSGYGTGGYGGSPSYGYGNGGNYGSGYGPYLPSYPPYDSSYAPYSNYYRAYPQVPHYMTGDTNLLGQQLCRWANYPSANMPCGWDPQQPVYDAWTGTYY